MNVASQDWHNWRWQLRNLIRTPEALQGLLSLDEQEVNAVRKLQAEFRFAITPYYFSLIDPCNPDDPIRRMIVPSSAEIDTGEIDPLAETENRVAPGIVRKYPDRVLFLVTSFCSSYCRFCIRKRNWTHSDAAQTRTELDAALAYIRDNEEIRDVLLSGGDPLTLPVQLLDSILSSLRAIKHVQFIRIGSREPVMLPMRIDDELLRVLDRHGPIWINTHFNHPREITPEAAMACERLARIGIPLNNQSVLLAGVNDSLPVMRELVHRLLQIRVRPYYLYQADPVIGTTHLRTSVTKGLEIIQGLRSHTTGLAVPEFVVDSPAGKIPFAPDYIVDETPSSWIARGHQGALVRIAKAAS